MADDQATEVPDTEPAQDAAPEPEPAQAPDATTQVIETVACQCRSTYHWRHGGGACPNPARWCQWCKDGGCVLARQADAARASRHGRSSRHEGRRTRRRRRHRGGDESDDGIRSGGMMPTPRLPALPLPPTVPFPMLPFPRLPLPLPMPMVGAKLSRGRDMSDASSSSSSSSSSPSSLGSSSSSSSSGGSSDDGRRDLERMSLQLYRPPRKGGCGGKRA